MQAVPLAALCLALVGAGCIGGFPGDPVQAETLILTFTLFDESGEGGEASPGPHCSTAVYREGALELERDVVLQFGDSRPLLVVLPALEGGWATLGTGGYPATLPYHVPTGIPDEPQTVGHIDWEEAEGDGSGHLLVDGQGVALPHEWTTRDRDGDWRSEARLEKGPDSFTVFERETCA